MKIINLYSSTHSSTHAYSILLPRPLEIRSTVHIPMTVPQLRPEHTTSTTIGVFTKIIVVTIMVIATYAYKPRESGGDSELHTFEISKNKSLNFLLSST